MSEIEIAGVLTNPIARGGVGKKKILFNPFPSSSDYRPFCTSSTFYENGYEQTSTKTKGVRVKFLKKLWCCVGGRVVLITGLKT